ncbi:hypothetical protein ACSAZK_02740 [Methanosarcina sp. Mfa9]|uniref:hypothetical protein n=1 Tax=Methanosarcina sp. Mfa9 TaxID=3439063 RepID=UPI003F834B1E
MLIDIISDPGNLIVLLPTAVILISATIYYFGVRFGDTQTTEHGTVSHYFFGVLFIISYMLEPYLILFFVKYLILLFVKLINEEYISYSPNVKMCMFLVILGLFIEIILYFLFHYSAKEFRKRLEPRYTFDDCEEGNDDCEEGNLRKWIEDIFKNLIFTRSAPIIIIFIIYGIIYGDYYYGVKSEIILLSLTLAFLTFTDIAFCAGFCCARYRKNVLYLKNGKNIKGIILKYGSYINVLTKDGTYSINKDDISTIKTSKYSK